MTFARRPISFSIGGWVSVLSLAMLAMLAMTAPAGAQPAGTYHARVTVMLEDAAPLTHLVTLDANSRTNVPVGPTPEFAAAIGTRFGVLVESLGDTPAQIVVERSTYSNGAGGAVWAAGSATLATRLR